MNKTVKKPGAPEFALNEIVYAKASAKRGYIEPLKIANISYDVQHNTYNYSFYNEFNSTELHPITFLEFEVISLCDALDIQIRVLTTQLAEKQNQYYEVCNEQSEITTASYPTEDKEKISLPQPRFGHNEVVYLRDTAQTTGDLESYRIHSFEWDKTIEQWVYSFIIKPRPEKNMTVGDRGDLTHTITLQRVEEQLCSACEALSLCISFLQTAVNRAQLRKTNYC